MICFLLEARKELLDNIIKMHDQFMIDLSRRTRNRYEKKHKQFRRKNKRAVDILLKTSDILLNWQSDSPLQREDIFETIDEDKLRESVADLYEFKYLSERGYADLFISHYPSLRKYFADLLQLPFEAAAGSEDLLKAIEIVRQIDSGQKIKNLPADAPVSFIPQELKPALKTTNGKLNRNAWEMGLALAIKENMRSGNLFIPKSKQYISFWKMLLENRLWEKERDKIYTQIGQPYPEESIEFIKAEFYKAVGDAKTKFANDNFAKIRQGKLQISQDKKTDAALQAKKLQALIGSGLPLIRIENLLMEVDNEIGFTRHFTPLQKHQNRPENFYKTLISAILSNATNLGIVAMSASVEDVSVDMLRYVLNGYIREETLINANAAHRQSPSPSADQPISRKR